jgi:hypothetical protein
MVAIFCIYSTANTKNKSITEDLMPQSQQIIPLITIIVLISWSSRNRLKPNLDKKYIDLIILVINPFETFKTNFRYVGNTYKHLFLLAHSLTQ